MEKNDAIFQPYQWDGINHHPSKQIYMALVDIYIGRLLAIFERIELSKRLSINTAYKRHSSLHMAYSAGSLHIKVHTIKATSNS